MKWRVDFSKNSLKFLERNNVKEEFVVDKINLPYENLEVRM